MARGHRPPERSLGRNLFIVFHTHHGKDTIDLDVIVGEQGKHCRLVAMRAALEITAARRAERRKKARESGKIPCPKGVLHDGCYLMLTNLSKAHDDVSQLAAIYSARWAVEIHFLAWKQALNLGKARDLAELITFDPDPRHLVRDKRTRKSPVESGISALT